MLAIVFTCHLLWLADTGDDVLHVVDGDSLDALLTEFVKQFCDTGLNVINDFVATLLTPEVTAERLDVLL